MHRRAEALRRLCSVGAAGALLVVVAPQLLAAACVGDCDNDGRVRIHEVQRAINAHGDPAAIADCPNADQNGDGTVVREELDAAITSFLAFPDECPAVEGLFFEPRVIALDDGAEPVAVAAGDFNGDAFPDLVVLNPAVDSLTQLNNDGSGHFAPFGANRFIGADTAPLDVTSFRKNSDAFDDFAVVRQPTSEEQLDMKCLGCVTFWQSTEGTFRPETVGVGLDPLFIRAGDLDGDGADDLVVVIESDDALAFLPNDPQAAFREREDIPTVPFVAAVEIADFNKDGALDLAAVGVDGGVVHLNTGTTPRFTGCETCPVIDAGIVPAAVESADVDGDGNLDLLIADGFLDAITVHLGHGDGTFEAPTTIQTEQPPGALVAADFDGDGDVDIATASASSDVILVFLGDGSGGFAQRPMLFAAGSSPSSLVAADFNRDGRPDLATAAQFDDAVVVLINAAAPAATAAIR